MSAFNWTQLIPQVGHHYDHIATLGIASGIAITSGFYAKSALGSGDAAVVPANKLSIRGIFEILTEFISGQVQSVIGPHGKKLVPFYTAVFSFLLLNNLIGVLPGMTPATENINTTFAFGVFMFMFYHVVGVRSQGISSYLAHFAGPILLLAPLMFVIEVISHCVRPFSLGLRLANVLTADHQVLGVFLDLVPVGIPMIFYVLGIFVAFVQAFVFTLLSMVYVSLAMAHDH